jgi:prophage DNA circulation protein
MAWEQTLLDASFRGVSFEVLAVDDESARALGISTYPYVDGADIEDLGGEPRRITVDAIFEGDQYETALQNFLKVFNEPGSGDLIHPVFGNINAQPDSYTVHHEADLVNQAMVTLVFLENTPGAKFFDRTLPVQKAAAVAQSIEIVREEAGAVLAQEVGAIAALKNAFVRVEQLRATMNEALFDLRGRVVGFITSGLDAVDFPLSWARDVAGLISGMVDLRGFNLASLSADWRSVFNTMSTPVKYAGQATQPARDAKVISSHVRLEQALGKADAAQAVLRSEAETPTLSAPEIELMVNEARETIQVSIDEYRDLYDVEQSRPITEALKTTALNLQQAARAVIEVRPPLIKKTVEAPGNFRLLAHRFYGDHTRAPELYRLNSQVRQPNFIQMGDQLHAYAE